jgi:hypothetical protein
MGEVFSFSLLTSFINKIHRPGCLCEGCHLMEQKCVRMVEESKKGMRGEQKKRGEKREGAGVGAEKEAK